MMENERESEKGGRFGIPKKKMKKREDKFSPERKAAAEKHAASAPVQQRKISEPEGQGIPQITTPTPDVVTDEPKRELKVKKKAVNYRLRADLLDELELLSFISKTPMTNFIETGLAEVVEREMTKKKAELGDKFYMFKELFEMQKF